ncbi:hypothetical protein [Pedobacter psychroterrae]|nr:hypothetical protein [Pedobacter psychroterrae]
MNNTNKDKNPTPKNPIIRMIEDKDKIVEAIRSGKDLSKLKGIKFVSPI